jgi:hypothetical protein
MSSTESFLKILKVGIILLVLSLIGIIIYVITLFVNKDKDAYKDFCDPSKKDDPSYMCKNLESCCQNVLTENCFCSNDYMKKCGDIKSECLKKFKNADMCNNLHGDCCTRLTEISQDSKYKKPKTQTSDDYLCKMNGSYDKELCQQLCDITPQCNGFSVSNDGSICALYEKNNVMHTSVNNKYYQKV